MDVSECHGSRTVLSERCWSTRMGVRGHGFRGVGKVHYLCRVCVLSLSIVVRADKGPVRSWSHYGSTVIIIMCLITTPVWWGDKFVVTAGRIIVWDQVLFMVVIAGKIIIWDQVLVMVVIAGKIIVWLRGNPLSPEWFRLWSVNDHHGIEDTELLDIRDVVRESWVYIKLLVVI